MSVNTVLGFDFGLRYIGVAIGQTVTKSAHGLTTLSAKNGVPDWNQIKLLIQTWQPDSLIVGIPFNMDDREQSITHLARHFAEQLKDQFKLDIYMMDERLSSVEARNELFAAGGYRALDRKSVNAKAAELILQSWLNNNELY